MRNIDFATLAGLIIGVSVVTLAIITESDLRIFINIPGLLIVLGGTFAATLIKFPLGGVFIAMPVGFLLAGQMDEWCTLADGSTNYQIFFGAPAVLVLLLLLATTNLAIQ